jgi:hypothetical protein
MERIYGAIVQENMPKLPMFTAWHGEHSRVKVYPAPLKVVLLCQSHPGMQADFKFGQMA